ncbi:uncharacterized protein J8A68_002200 [[Candida] subhashii]|uniref:Post-GPI attachment to proteins factor 3 n=1 Tax=[Candida] subhashii TaxID=561895 RepID=A0A8J5QY68_9ASCO|nr:uncharacterized protein J8A68_002200 [[Candida] subhashii]KAG7664285.1 hypothetical protein J8A68_002200 [[Candida] subhashii]
MKSIILILFLASAILCSVGDTLPEFQACLQKCPPCSSPGIFWSCEAQCNYQCQQYITDQRERSGLEVVQFYGKWPFVKVFGIQEFFSTIFSLGNFYVNYRNFFKIHRQYRKSDGEYRIMYFQYLLLLGVSCIGWGFSTIFHLRDTAKTETLDYFGAFAIMLVNLNAIFVRYFELYKKLGLLRLWWFSLMIVFIYHCNRLLTNWDYSYNMKTNIATGIFTMVLWILHSLSTLRKYNKNYLVYNNSIQLLPFETKLLNKLNYISIAKSKLIPLIPISNNLFLLCGLSLEVKDFPPIARLIDAHSLWHLVTIFPSIIWFDWNIWDIEMSKIVTTPK